LQISSQTRAELSKQQHNNKITQQNSDSSNSCSLKTMQWLVERPLDGAVVARLSKENSAVARLPQTKGQRARARSDLLMVVAKGVGDAFGHR
jgi:hypothetical protein